MAAISVCAARVGSTLDSRLRLYPAIPHKTQTLHYSHRSGRPSAPSLNTVVRLKPTSSATDRTGVGRPVSRLPSPEPDPVPGADTDEPKLELVPEPAALDEPAEEEDEEDKAEKLAAGPTQDPLKL